MRKESSFTRCPCCRTSGTDRGLTSTWSWPMHHMRFFDARITQPTSLRTNGTNATTLTVAFQAKAGEEGFQIYVAPIIGTKSPKNDL